MERSGSASSIAFEPRHEKTGFFEYAKTKTQISLAVTAKLISVFVFATRIVQSLYFLNPKFQASGHLVWLCSPVCVKTWSETTLLVFSRRGSFRLRADTEAERNIDGEACQRETTLFKIVASSFFVS